MVVDGRRFEEGVKTWPHNVSAPDRAQYQMGQEVAH
jgi:hypothetical protein